MRFLLVALASLASACFLPPTLYLGDGGTGDGSDNDGPPGDVPTTFCAVQNLPELVAYYSFDEQPGSLTASEPVSGLHGTVQNATFVTGKHDNALSLDSTNDLVFVGSPEVLDNLSGPAGGDPAGISVCAWVFPTSIPLNAISLIIVDKTLDGDLGGWAAYLNTKDEGLGNISLRVAFYTNFHDYTLSEATVPLDAWTHVCMTWDGEETAAGIGVYANGDRSPPIPDDPATTGREGDEASHLAIGRQSSSPKHQFPGLIDEVLIYRRVLTETEVDAIHRCVP